MENNLAVWNSHVHRYETPQIIKQIRVIVLHGNRGTVLRCYRRMTDLRSYPLWFSSTPGKEKEIICLSWSWRKRNNTGNSISRRHQLEETDHGMKHQFTHAVWSQGRGQFCWHMYPLRCRVSGPKKRMLHSKHGDVPATWSAEFKDQNKIQRAKRPTSQAEEGLQGNNRNNNKKTNSKWEELMPTAELSPMFPSLSWCPFPPSPSPPSFQFHSVPRNGTFSLYWSCPRCSRSPQPCVPPS